MKTLSLKLLKAKLQSLSCFFSLSHIQPISRFCWSYLKVYPESVTSISPLLPLSFKTPLTLASITASVSNWSPYFCSRHLQPIFHPAVGMNFKEHVRLCHFFLHSLRSKASSLTLKAPHDHPLAASLSPATPTLHSVPVLQPFWPRYCFLPLHLSFPLPQMDR